MNGDWTQLGIAGLTLLILFFIVRYFVQAITLKDKQIIEMVKEFNETVSNHMEHQTAAFKGLSTAIKELTKEIKIGNGRAKLKRRR